MNSIKTVKVGIISSQPHDVKGGSNYETSVSEGLKRNQDLLNGIELVFYKASKSSSKRGKNYAHDDFKIYKTGKFSSLFRYLRRTDFGFRVLSKIGLGNSRLENTLHKDGISLAYFLSPNVEATDIWSMPLITTVWDLGHRALPGIPELSANREWDHRENLFKSTVAKSAFVFTDSRNTGESLERIYGLRPERWSSIGLFPQLPEIRDDYVLPGELEENKYFVYPAQAWSHKNHVTILEAFARSKARLLGYKLVFTGGHGNNSKFVYESISSLQLTKDVNHLGLVPQADLWNLINYSKALLMPTLLGPTNLPPLEAALLGKQSLISDVHFFDDDLSNWMKILPAQDVSSWLVAMDGLLDDSSSLNPLLLDEGKNILKIYAGIQKVVSQVCLWGNPS